jgi:hypothetical protein
LLIFCFVGIRLSDQIKDDVQKAGVAEVPEINVLIEHMSSYIINSRSDNIAKSYYYSFNRWSTFAKKHSFDVLPAQPVHIALFITYLLDSGATHNTINSIIYSIKWVHGMCNKNDRNKKSNMHGLSWQNIEAMFLCESRPTVKRIIIRFCNIVTSRVNNVT